MAGRWLHARLVFRLSLERASDHSPCFDNADRGRGQVVANRSMKLAEIVARDRAVHVMLCMPIHVPIQEPN